jgi:hypothetical protein
LDLLLALARRAGASNVGFTELEGMSPASTKRAGVRLSKIAARLVFVRASVYVVQPARADAGADRKEAA